jgi:hypothetical protein
MLQTRAFNVHEPDLTIVQVSSGFGSKRKATGGSFVEGSSSKEYFD